ncbi:MAG: hydroxymethylglutaryl-CoA synthase [Gammaproteobacteria bacterium]|nr:hydroxymethylglutaryl-CoA synthase [Gammaproteobacteria bacterium]
MVKVGIDKLALYTSCYALELATLAKARGIDADKYQAGLGQYVMSVPPPGEDVVTMGANAAKEVLRDIDVSDIDMLMFATESGIDQSKAAGMYIHGLLALSPRCRVVELKQACYAGTAALQLALPYLRENPHKKVLVIASDIARYGLQTAGESSQGAAAVAMLLSTNPRILAFENESGIAAENVMDFWRPNYLHEALVDGKYSSRLYLTMLEKSWEDYKALSGRQLNDHAYFCYHNPVPRLVEKAHQHLLKCNQAAIPEEEWFKQMNDSLEYGRQIGNSYTASLYVGLASLLDNTKEDIAHKRIGFYSYGSGCVAEFFSGVIQPGYREALSTAYHTRLLAERRLLTYDEYAAFYSFSYVADGSEQVISPHQTGGFRLSKMQQHKRIYEKINTEPVSLKPTLKQASTEKEPEKNQVIKVHAPGKLILSGEHAVVYGHPALAMAINRYVTATVTREALPQVLFDLSDLAHRSQLTLNALRLLKDRIKRKYHRFIRGDDSIREVLQKPFELAQFALSIFAEAFNLSLPHGVKVHVQSDLPIGCGMGSSAATILSVLQATANYLQLPISADALFQLALEVENMQHGRSSGLDLHVAMQGGCLYSQGKTLEKRAIPSMPLYLVNTGTPSTTTGQCVEKVAPYFKSSQLGSEFAAVTHLMDAAMQQHSLPKLREAVRHNHQLLTQIGVVPPPVQQFIKEVESLEGAAKICGAGAVAGNAAGAVLVITDNEKAIQSLATRAGYHIIPITGDIRGVHAA